jgi:hypothetical protein
LSFINKPAFSFAAGNPIRRVGKKEKKKPLGHHNPTTLLAMAMDPVTWFLFVGKRFTNNLKATFDGMSPEKWIRLVIIIGGYMLLRPYLVKFASKQQMQQHQDEEKESKAKISPNELRGKVNLPEDSDEEEEAQASSTNWGKKARKRQRNMIKKMLDAEEQRLREQQEDDEDKDIEEYLVG